MPLMHSGIEETVHHTMQTIGNNFVVTGLENILTTETFNMAQFRHLHCRIVLQEQARQNEVGEYNEGMIALVSERISEWAVKRALKIASYGEVDQKSSLEEN